MKHYEMVYILPGRYTESEVDTIAGQINGLIKKYGGEITFTDNLGDNKLAYPIRKTPTGIFVVIEFNAEPEKIKEFDGALKLTPEILRFQIVNKKMKTQEEIEKEKIRQEKMLQRITQKKEEGKAPPPPKVSLEELDKKLGEILEGEIL